MSTIKLDKREDGVAVVSLDTPYSPVNILSRELFDELPPILDDIASDDAVVAVVLASAKPGTFVAGADLKQLLAIDSVTEGETFSKNGHVLLDRIAASPKPVVAAIWGPALGGGLELALACHYRIAADDPKTVLALPEVQLGLLPGGGGTVRLPRTIGIANALPMMLTGKRIRARRAKKLGLVDAVTSPGGIVDTAALAARQLADGTLRPTRKLPALQRWLARWPLRKTVLGKARAEVLRKTRGLYPAPNFILDCVEAGLADGPAAGAAAESALFGQLTAGPEAKNLIRLFESMTDLKKAPDDLPPPREVRRLGVLGGGFMGAGIAAVSVSRAPVTVKDISEDVLAGCVRQIHDGLKKRARSGAIPRFDVDRLLSRIHPTTDDDDLARADLVIEAVFEDLELKRRLLHALEDVLAPEAVFASNTSALPIGDIAEGARYPDRILGMHYFSPVPKMPLLEIIVTDRTSPEALSTARAFGVAQGKTVIVVKDGPGFYTSRILSPFLNEAVVLLREGARIEDVDAAVKDFGYPVGPITLLDEVGIDVVAHVAENFGDLYADRGLSGGEAFLKLREAGYAGRKNKKGFYRYDDTRKRRGPKPVNDAVYSLLGSAPRHDMPHAEIAGRLAFLMINEAVYCLHEDIIACPRDGDIGAVLGLGFPPFRGGPFRYLDAVGTAQAAETMERYAERFGPRFEPAPLLREYARDHRSFYP